MIANGECIGHASLVGFCFQGPGGGLFKQNTHGSMDITECGSLSIIKIIIGLLGIIHRLDAVQSFGVVGRQLSRKFNCFLRRIGIISAGDAGLKKEC